MSALLDFKGPVEGYVVNYVKKNGWKVEGTQEPADLVQDAYIVYARVCRKYPDVEEAKHLMALFKTAWHRHFTDLANADTASRIAVPIATMRNADGDEAEFESAGDVDNDGALATMIRQAPAEVSTVLNLFLNAPQELLDIAMASWSGPDKRKRAGGCEHINRMLGLPAGFDAMQAVHDYFH